MKRIHPHASQAVGFAALSVLIGLCGCRTPSGSVANPFLAPNRVPPPATRAILPGQAQPYYPGDPLPVMQSQTAPTLEAGGLAWHAPAGESQPTVERAEPGGLAFSSEPTVAIPADDGSLRFAQTSVGNESPPITPTAPAPMPAVAETLGQNVVQASYTEPVLSRAAPAPTNPWRSPQIAQAAPPVAAPTPRPQIYPTLPPPPLPQPVVSSPIVTQPVNPQQFAAAQNPMDVRLRAVVSPLPESGPVSTPRIRLPGRAVSQTASFDGFRPRSSMR